MPDHSGDIDRFRAFVARPDWQALCHDIAGEIVTVATMDDENVIDPAFSELHGSQRVAYMTLLGEQLAPTLAHFLAWWGYSLAPRVSEFLEPGSVGWTDRAEDPLQQPDQPEQQ